MESCRWDEENGRTANVEGRWYFWPWQWFLQKGILSHTYFLMLQSQLQQSTMGRLLGKEHGNIQKLIPKHCKNKNKDWASSTNLFQSSPFSRMQLMEIPWPSYPDGNALTLDTLPSQCIQMISNLPMTTMRLSFRHRQDIPANQPQQSQLSLVCLLELQPPSYQLTISPS